MVLFYFAHRVKQNTFESPLRSVFSCFSPFSFDYIIAIAPQQTSGKSLLITDRCFIVCSAPGIKTTGALESPLAEVVSEAEQMAESPGDVRLRDYEDMHKRGLFIGLVLVPTS